jgi:hypothetical protein
VFNETAYNTVSGLSDLEGVLPTIIGAGGSIGGSVVGGMIGGSWGGPIGAGIGLLTGLISGIFSAHAAKVQREDEISNAWAAAGPQAIDAVMNAYHTGQVSGPEAAQALDQIEAQFKSMTSPITKYNGKFGAFPDPNGPRPPDKCNWACGTYWDLHKQIVGLKAGLNMSQGKAGAVGELDLAGLTGDPIMLLGLGVIAFLLFK